MWKKLLLLILITAIFLFSKINYCHSEDYDATSNIHCESQNIEVGDDFSISLSVSPLHFCNISAFRIITEFDSSKFIFKNVSLNSTLNKDEIKYDVKDNILTVIYVTSNQGIDISPNKETQLFSLNFQCSKDTVPSSSAISAKIDGISDYNTNKIYVANPEPVTVNIVEKTLSDCTLKNLVPSEGTLYPLFSPQIYNYDLNVSYSTKSIEFNYSANNTNTNIKINRKKLNSAGKTTPIIITVSDTNTKNKAVYTITVHRESEPTSQNSNASINTDKLLNNESNTEIKQSKSEDDYASQDNNDLDSTNTNDSEHTQDLNNTSSNNIENYQDKTSCPMYKTIIVKENKFNIFFAGICTACLLFIIVYIIYNKLKNNTSNKTLK